MLPSVVQFERRRDHLSRGRTDRFVVATDVHDNCLSTSPFLSSFSNFSAPRQSLPASLLIRPFPCPRSRRLSASQARNTVEPRFAPTSLSSVARCFNRSPSYSQDIDMSPSSKTPHAFYPHIIESIVSYTDYKTKLQCRATCRAPQQYTDKLLITDVLCVTVGPDGWAKVTPYSGELYPFFKPEGDRPAQIQAI